MTHLINKFIQNKHLVLICKLLLAGIFISSAFIKIINPAAFADAVAAYKIIPIELVNIFSIALMWTEMFAGIAILINSFSKSAALIVAGLNIVFIIAVISAISRGLNIECGCFTISASHSKVGIQLITRDLILLLISIPVIMKSDTH